MRYREDKETSGEILRRILPEITRHGSGFQPPSYAIWYEYVSNCNPPLKQALDARLKDDAVLSSEETHSLYATYVAGRDAKALEEFSTQLQRTLEEFRGLAANAGSDAQHFGQSLQEFDKKLTTPLDVDGLRGIVAALASETRRMQASNRALSNSLEASQREFLDLKSQLTTVQNEALLDPLTGLNNRRGFQRHIDEVLALRPEGLTGCALLMVDIDHFKRVNDTHGHLLGDKVLQTVAQVLLTGVKGRDVAARLGGEEFAVLLPDTPTSGAVVLAEQIRRKVAQGRIRRTDRDDLVGSVTISLGVAAYQPGETLEEWIDRADQALYQSKQRGRNCVTLAKTEYSVA
jgi:diguanylate cyclase